MTQPVPSSPPPQPPRRVRIVQGQEVSLGCGTLILIALIVMLFGRGGTQELERDIQRLRSDISELRRAIDGQTQQLKTLQDKLDKGKQ